MTEAETEQDWQRPSTLRRAIKAICDYVVAAPVMVLAAPPLVLIAVLVRLDSPGPVLHRRRVVGRGGKEFDAYKVRTMRVDGESLLSAGQRATLRASYKLEDDPRVTRLGRVLRRYSLDELPQLANVVLGQMSVVGPRMISPQELGRYGSDAPLLLSVKPGITGPWQVEGRSELSAQERVRLDLDYARKFSLLRDLGILLRTPGAVLSGRGAY